MSTFQHIPGTFDILPIAHDGIAPSHAWRHVERVVRRVLEGFGFEELRTPTFEPTALVARGVGGSTDIVQKEMFAFTKGDTDYVLRPEMTAPAMRAYLEHRLDQRGGTQRLYYLGSCYRAERPQKGRYRQFHQFGVEIIGPGSPHADAEAIAAMMEVYRAFGLTDTRLRLNSLGSRENRAAYREALQAYFQPYTNDLSELSRGRLVSNPLRILDTKDEREIRLLDGAPALRDFLDDDSRAHYETLQTLLDAAGIAYDQDDRLVRGLDYYGYTTWELEGAGLGAQASLAGGGRYNGLAETLGARETVPAVGFAAGMERLFLALDAAGYAFPDAATPDAFLVVLDGGGEAAFRLGLDLRRAGLSVASTLKRGSFKALMKDAVRSGAPRYVLIGETEAASGIALVKDASTGDQTPVPFAELAAFLQGQASNVR